MLQVARVRKLSAKKLAKIYDEESDTNDDAAEPSHKKIKSGTPPPPPPPTPPLIPLSRTPNSIFTPRQASIPIPHTPQLLTPIPSRTPIPIHVPTPPMANHPSSPHSLAFQQYLPPADSCEGRSLQQQAWELAYYNSLASQQAPTRETPTPTPTESAQPAQPHAIHVQALHAFTHALNMLRPQQAFDERANAREHARSRPSAGPYADTDSVLFGSCGRARAEIQYGGSDAGILREMARDSRREMAISRNERNRRQRAATLVELERGTRDACRTYPYLNMRPHTYSLTHSLTHYNNSFPTSVCVCVCVCVFPPTDSIRRIGAIYRERENEEADRLMIDRQQELFSEVNRSSRFY